MVACAGDDRYNDDDVHYVRGCILKDQHEWAANMLYLNARAPDPLDVGDGWRDLWLQRLDSTPPYIHTWLAHQRRDAFWKHGSVAEDYAAIACPTFLVGGWNDGYRRAFMRLLECLEAPRLGIIGPWEHDWPHEPSVGPGMGFLRLAVRWWDHWLKGVDNGVMAGPMLRAYMQEPAPGPIAPVRPGRWVVEPTWPSEGVLARELFPTSAGDLSTAAMDGPPLQHRGVADAGIHSGIWKLPLGRDAEMRAEDGRLAHVHDGALRGAPRASGPAGGRSRVHGRPSCRDARDPVVRHRS